MSFSSIVIYHTMQRLSYTTKMTQVWQTNRRYDLNTESAKSWTLRRNSYNTLAARKAQYMLLLLKIFKKCSSLSRFWNKIHGSRWVRNAEHLWSMTLQKKHVTITDWAGTTHVGFNTTYLMWLLIWLCTSNTAWSSRLLAPSNCKNLTQS